MGTARRSFVLVMFEERGKAAGLSRRDEDVGADGNEGGDAGMDMADERAEGAAADRRAVWVRRRWKEGVGIEDEIFELG